ncbi:DUF2332 family protein [Streptomyces sp. NPDC000880]
MSIQCRRLCRNKQFTQPDNGLTLCHYHSLVMLFSRRVKTAGKLRQGCQLVPQLVPGGEVQRGIGHRGLVRRQDRRQLAPPVVFHSAVLTYLPTEAQESFAETVRALPGHWISNEGPRVLPSVGQRLPRPAPEDRAAFVLALDGQPVAFTGPHGQSLDWFA